MIREENHVFELHTKHTSYVFRVEECGHLEHLYYGRRIHPNADMLAETRVFAPGCSVVYDQEHTGLSLDDICLEVSAFGKGDTREPFIDVVFDDGSTTTDFVFSSWECKKGKTAFETLPTSYDDSGECEELCITLEDKNSDLKLLLFYTVFEKCDVITRSVKLVNDGCEPVRILRLMSMQMDFLPEDYVLTTFHGAWGREMRQVSLPLVSGKYVNESVTGNSSAHANPFFMLGKAHTTEDYGDCFGFNLIYSGNHYEAAQVSSMGKIRLVSGINPIRFSWILNVGECFEAPEAVMTYSHKGYNGMSQNMHAFVREHIVRGKWKNRLRPVLLNSWEAAYFDINERKLLKLAKAGSDVGIELFVVDDGWFGERDNDTKSLGDWNANTQKLPGGIEGLSAKVRALGLDFGIWVEPEMVNVDSKLYREHPDWVICHPAHEHSEGRNQRILDLSNPDVQDFIIEKMGQVFTLGKVSYVKWDMNRNFSDYYFQHLPAKQQSEGAHRYMLGLYRCMKTLTEQFPDILFEGCASGGNRFDLGILSYFPQIWASDNTDALCRAEIQNGYSYGYPMSVVSAHVSGCPNHQTLRKTPLETRFGAAAFGVLGYEFNFCDLSKEELDDIKQQIILYKQWREVLMTGAFYRGRSWNKSFSALDISGNNIIEWTCVSRDKKKAVGFLMQAMAVPNRSYGNYRPVGLDENMQYHFYNRSMKVNIEGFGDLVNTMSPVHIRQDSAAHRLLARFVKLDGETQDGIAYGDALMYGGVTLKPAFCGTGFNGQVRYFPDFGARLYFMESLETD